VEGKSRDSLTGNIIEFSGNLEEKNQKSVSQTQIRKNDVRNQQDATTFSFINFLNQPYMFRAANSPILRSTF